VHDPLELQRSFGPFEVKAVDPTQRLIEAYVAVWGDPKTGAGADKNGDIIVKGAFAKALSLIPQSGRPVPLIGHDLEALRIGRCVDLHEDDYGLWTRSYIYPTTAGTDLLITAAESLAEGDPLGNSIGYKPEEFDYVTVGGITYRVLRVINPFVEYSFLATRRIAANASARTLSVKSHTGDSDVLNLERKATLLAERKAAGMADGRGADLTLMTLAEQLDRLGERATADLLAYRQLGMETKADARMSPTVLASVRDLHQKLGSVIDAAATLPVGVDPDDEPGADQEMEDMGSKAAPPEHGKDGAYQPADNGRDIQEKRAPAERATEGGADPAGSSPSGGTAYGAKTDDVEEKRDFDPNVGGGKDRDKIPAEDFAGKNRSFPITSPSDVSDAARSIGRAGADNYDHETLKANIVRIAKRHGWESALPDAWKGESKALDAEPEQGEPGHHEPDDDDFGGPPDGDDDDERKRAPAESDLSGDDDMRALGAASSTKSMTEGSDEGGGYLTDRKAVDVERERLELLKLGAELLTLS